MIQSSPRKKRHRLFKMQCILFFHGGRNYAISSNIKVGKFMIKIIFFSLFRQKSHLQKVVLSRRQIFSYSFSFFLPRYASLYFIAGVSKEANELLVLEVIQRYVETLDKCFGNVCELDLIFNFQKVPFILIGFLLIII